MTDQGHNITDQTADDAERAKKQKDTHFVAKTIAAAVGQSINALNQRNEVSNAAMAAMTIILAALPETAQLKPERVATVMGFVLRDNPGMQREVADIITGIVNTSRELPKAMAAVAAQHEMDQAKAGGAKPN